MDLLLWRHAEAEDGYPDQARRLTKRGEKQARKMAEWLRQYAPKEMRIIASPAIRCQQTVAALGLPFETDERLSTSGDAQTLLAAAGWPKGGDAGTVLVVGHQPTLGQAAAMLLTGEEDDWAMKKGAIWWFNSRATAPGPMALRAAMDPDVL